MCTLTAAESRDTAASKSGDWNLNMMEPSPRTRIFDSDASVSGAYADGDVEETPPAASSPECDIVAAEEGVVRKNRRVEAHQIAHAKHGSST